VTDPDLIAKKLALIETSVRELRTLSRPAAIPVDGVQERFVEHTLQIIMRRMVGFRNILVHGYEIVDVGIVRDVVEHRLDDLLRLVGLIRSRLP
jgi:uncharacterized protein YutE (UPF0331/DUF86 family)